MSIGNQGGRPPKPTELKLVQGTARKHRMSDNEPTPGVGLLPPPAHLSAGAKREYNKTGERLVKVRVLTENDCNTLALYAAAWDTSVVASRGLRKTGYVVTNDKGNLVKSPWWILYNEAVTQLIRFTPELGLSPSSRTRVHTVKAPDKVDPLSAFLAEGAGD